MLSTASIAGYEFLDGRFYADVLNRDVFKKGDLKPITLTPKEFSTLEFFLKLKNPNRLVKREEITPLEGPYTRHPADDYLSKITAKLGLDKGVLFKNKPGIGYSLVGRVTPITESDQRPKSDIFHAAEQHLNTHTTDSMRTSLQQCLKELQKDPSNPDIHVTAAFNYLNLCQSACAVLPAEDGIREARHHATRALAMQPNSARALAALGLISMTYDHNWIAAKTHLESAVALKTNEGGRPLLVYSHFLVATGKLAEAVDRISEAAEVDPANRLVQATVGWIYLYAGDVSKAIEHAEKAESLYPDLAIAQNVLGRTYEAVERFEEARRHFEFALKTDYSPANLASAGYLRALLGDSEAAKNALESMVRLCDSGKTAYVPAFFRAHVLAGLGETKECLRELWIAYEQRADWLIHLGVERRWDPIRHYDKFKDLVEQVSVVTPPRGFRKTAARAR